MQTISLNTQAVAEGSSAKTIRAEGKVPCILYGNDVDHAQFMCDYSELFRVYAKAGESVLVDLDVNGKKVPSLFHEVQFEPVSDKIIHVDFYAVDMKKEIEARVPLHFTGESEAVNGGGVLVTVNDHLTVKCLPTNLPSYLEVSLEKLVDFSAALLVSDVALPEGVVVVEEPDTMVATVQEPRQESEPEAAAEEGGEGAEGGEEKAEGGEKAEGEAEEKSE